MKSTYYKFMSESFISCLKHQEWVNFVFVIAWPLWNIFSKCSSPSNIKKKKKTLTPLFKLNV